MILLISTLLTRTAARLPVRAEAVPHGYGNPPFLRKIYREFYVKHSLRRLDAPFTSLRKCYQSGGGGIFARWNPGFFPRPPTLDELAPSAAYWKFLRRELRIPFRNFQ
jgi:hypothetical protein